MDKITGIASCTDEQLLEVIKKYRKQTLTSFMEQVDTIVDENPDGELNEVDVWDFILSKASDEEFLAEVVDSIDDSCGINDLVVE